MCIRDRLYTSSVINPLDLGLNPIGGNGLQSISEALIANTSLVKLKLGSCRLVITEESGPILSEMVQRNKTLRHLDLGDNILSDIGAFYSTLGKVS